MKKVLCICQWGHSRSVALTRCLHADPKYRAVAIGVSGSGDAILALAPWADVIAVLEPHFADIVPPQHQHKVLHFNVGPDRWSNPYNAELLELLGRMVTDHQQSGAL